MSVWKGEITLGQTLGIAIGLLTAMVGTYVHTQVRISLLEKEMQTIRKEFDVYKTDQDYIRKSLIRIEINQEQSIQMQERFQSKFDAYDAARLEDLKTKAKSK
jgi:hypothetical protein